MSNYPTTFKLSDLQNTTVRVEDFKQISCKNGQTSIVLNGINEETQPIQFFANNKLKQFLLSDAMTLPFTCEINAAKSFITKDNGVDRVITYIPVQISAC